VKISFALFLSLFISLLSGQTVRGTVEGTLTDTTGGPVAAAITITSEETGEQRSASSNGILESSASWAKRA
jgi:hypothetical protein